MFYNISPFLNWILCFEKVYSYIARSSQCVLLDRRIRSTPATTLLLFTIFLWKIWPSSPTLWPTFLTFFGAINLFFILENKDGLHILRHNGNEEWNKGFNLFIYNKTFNIYIFFNLKVIFIMRCRKSIFLSKIA